MTPCACSSCVSHADAAGVFVIGCTNRPRSDLDEAILRPGRLELHEEVGYPTLEDRAEIVALLARKTPLDAGVDAAWLASATQGYSGAKLQHLFRAAGMLAVEESRDCLSRANLEAAMRQLAVFR